MNVNSNPVQPNQKLITDSDILSIDNVLKQDASLPKFEKANENVVAFQKTEIVSAEKATESLRNLLKNADISIDDLEAMPTKNIALMAAAISMKSFSETADLSIKSLKTMTDAQEFVRNRQVEEFQEQLAKQIEESNKSNVGGILGAIFDWIIGAVEVVVGAFKVLEGAARCAVGDMTGLVSIASGALYISAGVSGLVKAAAETAILCGADKEKCQSVIDVASKVQLSCEVAGLATDIFQCGQAIMATRGLAKGAKEAVQHFAPAMGKAIAQNGADEILEIGQMMGKAVADEMGEKIMAEVVKRSSQESGRVSQAIQKASKAFIKEFRQGGVDYVGHTTSSLTKTFSREGIENIVKNAALDVAKNITKKNVSMSVEKAAEEMTNAICKGIRNEVIKGCVKATTYVGVEVARGTAGGVKNTGLGAINIERAKLLNEIAQNEIQRFMMDMVFETYEQSKEIAKKSVQDNYEKHGNVLSDMSQLLTDSASLNMKVASNIV